MCHTLDLRQLCCHSSEEIEPQEKHVSIPLAKYSVQQIGKDVLPCTSPSRYSHNFHALLNSTGTALDSCMAGGRAGEENERMHCGGSEGKLKTKRMQQVLTEAEADEV